MFTSSSTSTTSYEAPRIEDLGDLVALTAEDNGGAGGKPCIDPDGLSGNIGNNSQQVCGGVGS